MLQGLRRKILSSTGGDSPDRPLIKDESQNDILNQKTMNQYIGKAFKYVDPETLKQR